MKQIETLVPDILALFGDDKVDLSPERLIAFTGALSAKIRHRLEDQYPGATLRMSNVGKPCTRQLWYAVNEPETLEPIPIANRVKFLYGDILEEMLLYLAKEAGHTVEREQETVELDGVVGHIDAVVDGVLLDCKSASPFGYEKFTDGLSPATDDFGYLTQLELYLHGTGLNRGGFLAIQKVSGHICLDLHDRSMDREAISAVIESKRAALKEQLPPPRAFEDVADGASGNRKLGVACSYCPSAKPCWPGLRTFLYANGPRFLTEVRLKPKVFEA